MTWESLRKPCVTATAFGSIGGALTTAAFLLLGGKVKSHEFISAVAQLLWPIAVILVANWFREDVRIALARLVKGKIAGFEVEFGVTVPPTSQGDQRERSKMEFKILSTLWTNQVNISPRYEVAWTFRPSELDPDFVEYRDVSNKLIGEGFVAKTNDGQIYLTPLGFGYCKKNYKQFPAYDFFNGQINEEKLKEALGPG